MFLLNKKQKTILSKSGDNMFVRETKKIDITSLQQDYKILETIAEENLNNSSLTEEQVLEEKFVKLLTELCIAKKIIHEFGDGRLRNSEEDLLELKDIITESYENFGLTAEEKNICIKSFDNNPAHQVAPEDFIKTQLERDIALLKYNNKNVQISDRKIAILRKDITASYVRVKLVSFVEAARVYQREKFIFLEAIEHLNDEQAKLVTEIKNFVRQEVSSPKVSEIIRSDARLHVQELLPYINTSSPRFSLFKHDINNFLKLNGNVCAHKFIKIMHSNKLWLKTFRSKTMVDLMKSPGVDLSVPKKYQDIVPLIFFGNPVFYNIWYFPVIFNTIEKYRQLKIENLFLETNLISESLKKKYQFLEQYYCNFNEICKPAIITYTKVFNKVTELNSINKQSIKEFQTHFMNIFKPRSDGKAFIVGRVKPQTLRDFNESDSFKAFVQEVNKDSPNPTFEPFKNIEHFNETAQYFIQSASAPSVINKFSLMAEQFATDMSLIVPVINQII